MKESKSNFEYRNRLILWKDDTMGKRSFMLTYKDHEAEGDQWTIVCLTEDEARKVYEYLKQYFA